MHQYDAFVSYSRRDEALVRPVVKLLAVGKRKIFWDADVEPGERWMERITAALVSSATFIVLWCCHSAESAYVDAEIDIALANTKPLVPVWICPYPLRERVRHYQGIDFRRVTRHACPTGGHPNDDTFREESVVYANSRTAKASVSPALLMAGGALGVVFGRLFPPTVGTLAVAGIFAAVMRDQQKRDEQLCAAQNALAQLIETIIETSQRDAPPELRT